MVGVYVGAAAAVALLVATWTIAYGRGAAAGEREWQAEILASRAGNIGADPLIDPIAGGKGQETSAPPQGRQERTNTTQRQQSPTTGGLSSGLANMARAGILSSAGVLPSDPRQPGQNYLKLAVLSRADAEHAIAYLGSGGVEAIGVPVVDPGAGAGKNPSRYEVFATVGITGEEYRNNRPVRTELETKVARIGERYRREAKGSTDFAKPLWMKYNP
ncbi:MAG: hypothetical protein KF902_11435 [Phycisphaeraceae bacterium]|nr:hypothetical protein [Phycisphaeraceae bacterium]MCW5767381.1 hypothetical protein [Phycisphaeraceae bacterium]